MRKYVVNFWSALCFQGFFRFRASEITAEIKAILLCLIKQLPLFQLVKDFWHPVPKLSLL